MALRILASADVQHKLLDLPWDVTLAQWPSEHLVALPRGISRHVVRFTRLGGRVYALKEIAERHAMREYRLLRDLERLDVPSVEPVGVVTGRTDPGGDDLDPVLVTRHLQFSLPYRALFSRTLRPETVHRLTDALVALLVRLHVTGFFWGDCSLSNTLFRRDAGAFAAYLVDAETGELHASLSAGQRRHDLENATVNIAGELMDLSAGGLLHEGVDPFDVAQQVSERYDSLWNELYGEERFDMSERWRIGRRIERLNELGFDVAELDVVSDFDGCTVRIQPKVVDADHHSRRLLRLTGLDVEENQARRLLNDLDAYRAATDQQAEDEEIVAHEWLTDVYEEVLRAVPRELRGKLEPAEVFHEVLEHRWYLSERAGKEVSIMEAARSYVRDVLASKPDEKAVLGRAVRPGEPVNPVDEEDALGQTQPFRIPWDELA